MQRRGWLKLGVASALVLAVGGGFLSLVEPGLRRGRLTGPARDVMAAVASGLLDGSLPTEAPTRAGALDALLARIDALIAGLPRHAQAELSQLLALLASTAGRRTLAGLAADWPRASVADKQQALQSMRTSGLSLRRQAYHALHDITLGAYFSHDATWDLLGYPGPTAL